MNHAISSEMPGDDTIRTILALASDEFLTPKQAANELKVTRQTIYNYLKDPNNPLPAIKAGGWKIRRGDLAAYIQAQQVRETTEPQQQESQESDQTLRNQLLQLIEIARAALEWKRAGQILSASGGSFDLEFIERCSEDLIVKGGALSKQLGPITEETLTRIRFMLPSISSSLPLAVKAERD